MPAGAAGSRAPHPHPAAKTRPPSPERSKTRWERGSEIPMLRSIRLLALLVPLAAGAALAQAPAAQPAPVKPAELELKQINAAIAKAVQALYTMQPNYTFPPQWAYARYYN